MGMGITKTKTNPNIIYIYIYIYINTNVIITKKLLLYSFNLKKHSACFSCSSYNPHIPQLFHYTHHYLF